MLTHVWAQHTLTLQSTQWQSQTSKIDLLCKRIDLICARRVPCRRASLECTGPLWITMRLLWRWRTSAARQMLSLQRYLRYVITLRTAGLRQASIWCCTAARNKWWQGSFQRCSQCKSNAAPYSGADCFNCAVGQGFNEGIFFFSPFPLLISFCQNLKVKSTKDCKDQSAKNSLESEYWVKWMASLHKNQ